MQPEPGTTERELAAAVRDWAAGLGTRIAEAEKAGRLPDDVIRELAALGVLGMTVPEADGGLGASSVAFALVLEELAYAWPSLAVGVSVNSGIVAGSIVRFGTAAQRARWLPGLTDGSGLGAFALTEASSGSDAASLRATAAREGDGWVITGRKQFITNARYAPLAVVMARVGASERKMGLHASDTSALVLDGVRVGGDAVLGEIGRGFAIALAGLDGGRISVASHSVGIARAATDRAIAYARQRRQFGRALVEFEAIRFAFARARTETEAARLLGLRAAWLRDQGRPFTREASMAKLYASEAGQRVTRAMLQVFGGYGYLRDYEVERYARDVRVATLYEGTSEVQRLVIARSL